MDSALSADEQPARSDLKSAVLYLLQRLADATPGNSVEVRVPPFGAVQIIPGPRHTRGTPPAVVQMAPMVWINLALGRASWAEEAAAGRVEASGERSDLSAWLPVASGPTLTS